LAVNTVVIVGRSNSTIIAPTTGIITITDITTTLTGRDTGDVPTVITNSVIVNEKFPARLTLWAGIL
jgi:hypothetical protein